MLVYHPVKCACCRAHRRGDKVIGNLDIDLVQYKSAFCIVSAPSSHHKQCWVIRDFEVTLGYQRLCVEAEIINTVNKGRNDVVKYSKNSIYIVQDCLDVTCFFDLVI